MAEQLVSRVIALSIVLCVTAGQDAVAICRAWCGVQETNAVPCSHHQTPSRVVLRSQDHCYDQAPAVAAAIRDDVRRPVMPTSQVEDTRLSPLGAAELNRWFGPEPGPPLPRPHTRPTPLRI